MKSAETWAQRAQWKRPASPSSAGISVPQRPLVVSFPALLNLAHAFANRQFGVGRQI